MVRDPACDDSIASEGPAVEELLDAKHKVLHLDVA